MSGAQHDSIFFGPGDQIQFQACADSPNLRRTRPRRAMTPIRPSPARNIRYCSGSGTAVTSSVTSRIGSCPRPPLPQQSAISEKLQPIFLLFQSDDFSCDFSFWFPFLMNIDYAIHSLTCKNSEPHILGRKQRVFTNPGMGRQ